jgi:hypothetical protein
MPKAAGSRLNHLSWFLSFAFIADDLNEERNLTEYNDL